MPQKYIVTLLDGSKVESYARYDSEQVNQMNTVQLITMLSEFKELAHYFFSQIGDPINRLEEECKTLTHEKENNRENVKFYGIAAVVLLVISLILRATGHIRLFQICFIIAGIGAVSSIVSLISAIRAAKDYEKRYPDANAELQQLHAKIDAELYGTYIDITLAGKAILPDYYLNEAALDFMITALRNHRATTLAEVVNLFESTKMMQEQNNLLAAQVAAQQSAARSAAEAAAAAQNAADSASRAAMNSNYNRKF